VLLRNLCGSKLDMVQQTGVAVKLVVIHTIQVLIFSNMEPTYVVDRQELLGDGLPVRVVTWLVSNRLR
jgi:hypothetical protein